MAKIAIVGSGNEVSSLAEMALKEKFGEDVIVITAEQAAEQGIPMDEIVNIPTLKLKAPPMPTYERIAKTGRQQRRERRRMERKNKKY